MSCVTSAAPQIDSRFPSRLRALLVISEDELEELVWICRPKGSVICDDPLERLSREHRHHVRCEVSLSIGPFAFCIRSRAVQFTNDRANKIIENEDLLRLSEFDIYCPEAYALCIMPPGTRLQMPIWELIFKSHKDCAAVAIPYMRVQKQTIKKLRHKIIIIAASQLRAPS